MRDRVPTLWLRPKPARLAAGALLLSLAGGGLQLDAGASPSITSISPESGNEYAGVTITGTGFGSSRGTSTVTFGGTEASRYREWSDTEIRVSPPSSLAYGANAVVVTVGGTASNGANYTRLPTLTALCRGTLEEPSGTMEVGVFRGGPTTEAVTVAVTFGGTATHGADYTTPATLTIAAGESSATGTLTVVDDSGREGNERILYRVNAEGHIGDTCQVTLGDDDPDGTPAPSIGRLTPISGGVGVSVTITGSNFGVAKGTSTVTFNGTSAATTSWSATSITAAVPVGAATGRVLVTVGGQASNGLVFAVSPTPVIGGIDPTSGEPGTSVVITGSNFGASKRFSTVTFNGAEAVTTAWSATSIAATVPAGARTGNVVVTVGGVGSNGVAFTVIAPVRLECPSSVSEPSGMGDITARVDSGYEPVSGVTFAVTHSGTAKEGTDYTVGTLAMASGRSSGTMAPKLTVVDDSLSEGEETIELRVKAAGYAEAGCTVRLIDDEPAISGLEPAAGPVGASVAIAGSSFGAAKGTSTVSFNGTGAATTSWSATSITATVPAGARTGNVVVTVGGRASNGVPFTVTGVTVDPTELTVEEGGTGTYTVVLDSSPASAVTVSMFASEGTDLSVDILPVFTASNWDEPQTVTVTAGEDDDRVEDVDTIVHRTASADSNYHNLTVDSLVVTVTDNDTGAGVRVEPTELTIEEGETGTYTVVLNQAPSAEVTVTVTLGGDLTVNPASLTFTTQDWSTEQTVTVTAGEDEDAEDETETLTHAVTSTDTAYGGLAVDGVEVTVADDEGTGGPGGTEELTVSTTRLRITEGNMGKYTVVLNRAPSAAVTVTVSAPAGGDLTVSPARLDFTTSNWDTPQEVRVEAVQDTDLVDEVESITHTLTRATTGSSSSLRGGLLRDGYLATAMGSPAPTREYVYLGGRLAAISQGGAVGEVSVVVTIDDDDDPDTPGVPALTNSLRLTEGHTGAYTLELGAAPTANVAIALSVSRGSDNTADVTVNPARVTFTASNWDSPQWITVSVGRDDDTVGETETISHAATSTDSRYQGIAIPDVSVVIRDRNPTRMPKGTLTASPNPCTIAAGATTCSTTLRWTSTDTTAVQVRRIRPQEGSTSSINEIVVRSGSPDGDHVFTGIDLTDSPFYLYEYITSTRRRGRQLATVTVKGVKALSLSPDSGPVGTVVTIMGSAFGDSRGTGPNASTVTFNGTPVTTYTSWSDTRIVVEVPAEATTGEVVVTVGGTARTIGTFTVGTVPSCTITAAPNPCIIAKGRSTCTSTLTWTSMNTTAVRVWTKRQERTPFGYLGGTLTAFTTTDSTSGNQNATIEPAPRFRHEFAVHDHSGGSRGSQLCSVIVTGDRALSLSPASGPVGTSVTVMGSRFGARQGISTLTFGGAAVTPTSWSDTRIVFTVPQNATTGNKSAVVTVAREARTIGTFRVTPPPPPLSPTSGAVGTAVTISGTGFGTTQGSVSLGGISASITSWSDTRIVFTVPQNATAGAHTVSVTVSGQSRTMGTFTVTTMALPRIDSFTSDPEDIATNSHSTLAWQTSNAEQVTINGSSVPVDGAQDVRPSTTGSHTYTLVACASNCGTDTGNKKVTKTVTVTVWARPTISNCSADPTDVKTGGMSVLSWTATNAPTVTVTGTSGSVTSPHKVTLSTKGAHTFTLTASNPAWTGNYAATCTVTVTAWDEPTAAISANRTSINQGQPVTVTWSSSNAKTTVITGISGIGTVSGNSSGSRDLTPAQGSHDYTITASNPAWNDAGDSETVSVDARPTCTISASPNPCTIAASATTCTTTVSWSCSGTTGLLVRTSHNGQAERVHASSGRTGSSSPSWIQQSPAHSYVFYLYDYENRILGARLASVTVTGQPAPPAPPAPSISGILPSQGVPDSQVTISGSNFGTTEDTVSFGGSSAEIESWSDTSIDALVPRHLGRGTVSVTVTANGLTSTGVNFTVTGDPVRRDPEEDCEDPKDCPEEEEEEETPDP